MKPEIETNHKRLSISGNKVRVTGVEEGGRDGLLECWTLGRVCAMVSAVNCVRLMNHKPVPLKQIIYNMLIKFLKKDYMRFNPVVQMLFNTHKSINMTLHINRKKDKNI